MYHALWNYTDHATVMRIVEWLLSIALPIHFKHALSMVCLWTPLFCMLWILPPIYIACCVLYMELSYVFH